MIDSSIQKLFAVYLGGRADGCNIELHDVVFVVGASIEETYPMLARKWFGNLSQFHIDSYCHLFQIDGFNVELIKNRPRADSVKKLYFINFGAYKPGEFTEHHQSAFYVADSSQEALRRAKSELCKGLHTVHKDDLVVLDHVTNSEDYDVDDILEIKEVDDYFISLTPAPSIKHVVPISSYIKLDFTTAK